MTDHQPISFLLGNSFLQKTKDDAESAEEYEEIMYAEGIHAYDTVRITTDKYKDIGLTKGEIGTVVDIMLNPHPRYMVEFHEIPLEKPAGIQTFNRDEIESVEDSSDE